MASLQPSAAARIFELEQALAAAQASAQEAHASAQAAQAARQQLADEHALLKQAYEAVRTELALLKQRLFVAKAERLTTAQLQLEFSELTAKAEALMAQLVAGDAALTPPSPPASGRKARATPPPGRRANAAKSSTPRSKARPHPVTLKPARSSCGARLRGPSSRWRALNIKPMRPARPRRCRPR